MIKIGFDKMQQWKWPLLLPSAKVLTTLRTDFFGLEALISNTTATDTLLKIQQKIHFDCRLKNVMMGIYLYLKNRLKYEQFYFIFNKA